MKISYGITVCNEYEEIQRLIAFLLEHKRPEDEIVVLYDKANGDPAVNEFLLTQSNKSTIIYHESEFKGHFADWKNELSSHCNGDYIFQIDADEMIDEYVCRLLPQVLANNQIDVIRVPRINTVSGLTAEHIAKWHWQVNEQGWVNFPDYQWRIYRNNDKIKWKNRVHEELTGHKTVSHLPASLTQTEWCLIHDKTINRQERQNELYSKL